MGAFIRDLEARIAEMEAEDAGDGAADDGSDRGGGDGRDGDAGELRDALRLGRLLLAGEEVTL